MPSEHKVAQRSQLDEKRHLAVKIDDKELAVFLVGGEVLATAGRCPHANGMLARGSVCEGKVTCPWHGWTWDLRSGDCEESDELKLQRYEVRVRDDDVFVVV